MALTIVDRLAVETLAGLWNVSRLDLLLRPTHRSCITGVPVDNRRSSIVTITETSVG